MQSPIPEEDDDEMMVSFQSRHDLSAETPRQVGKTVGTGRQMHERAGLVFNCLKVKKALRKGNFASKIQTDKKL